MDRFTSILILTLCLFSTIAPSTCRSEPIRQPQFQETIEVTKGEKVPLSCQISHLVGEFVGCHWSAEPDVNGRSDFNENNLEDQYELKASNVEVLAPAGSQRSSVSCTLTIKSVAYEHGRLWRCHIDDGEQLYSSHPTKLVVHSAGLDGELKEIRDNLTHVWKEIQSVRGHLVKSDQNEDTEEKIVQTLGLNTDQDGFTYKLTHVTGLHVNGPLINESRPAASGVYHLSTSSSKRSWRKFVDSVGLVFWHLGSTHIFHLFHTDGEYYEAIRLGNPLVDTKATLMLTIPPETWYITTIDKSYGHYVLESASMTPGWSLDYWVKGQKEDIEKLFPSQRQLISNLSDMD